MNYVAPWAKGALAGCAIVISPAILVLAVPFAAGMSLDLWTIAGPAPTALVCGVALFAARKRRLRAEAAG